MILFCRFCSIAIVSLSFIHIIKTWYSQRGWHTFLWVEMEKSELFSIDRRFFSSSSFFLLFHLFFFLILGAAMIMCLSSKCFRANTRNPNMAGSRRLFSPLLAFFFVQMKKRLVEKQQQLVRDDDLGWFKNNILYPISRRAHAGIVGMELDIHIVFRMYDER